MTFDSSVEKQLDTLLAADDGLLDMPAEPRPVTETDRLVRAFNEINDFVEQYGKEPSAETLDISERKLGARLIGIRASERKTEELKQHDKHGLLSQESAPASIDELLEEDPLGLLEDTAGILDVSTLPVRKSPEDEGERAVRIKSKDFETFKDHFKAKHEGLADGTWKLTAFKGEQSITEGRFFVIKGVMCFVANVKETSAGETKPRLRVIFENSTESGMYRESLANRLYETGGQAVTRAVMTADEFGDSDTHTGYIYVLKSLSQNPDISSLHDLYKIGFSRGPVEKRIANAEKSPTYLMAPVEIVATYQLYNMRPSVLEHLLHRVFASVRLNATVVDSAGKSVGANEWFIAPLNEINRAIELIQSNDIIDYVYDRSLGSLIKVSNSSS